MARRRTRRPRLAAARAHPPMWREVLVQQWLLEEQTRLRLQSLHAARIHDHANQLQDRITRRERWVQQRLAEAEHPSGPTQPRPGGKKGKQSGKLRTNVFSILDDLAGAGQRPSLRVVNARLGEAGLRELSTLEFQGLHEEWLQIQE